MASWTRPILLLAALGGAAPAGAQESILPPAGYGTLRQDQVGVRLQTGNLAMRLLPLDERVTRLLSPDAYRSLRDIAHSRAGDIASQARAAGRDSVAVFIVTFFALQPRVRFNPDQVYVTSQNVFFRPIGIVPLTPRWSEYEVDQRQQAVAIYLFEPDIAVMRPFTVSYGDQSSDAWGSSLRLLESERARVLARAAQHQPPEP